MGRRRLPAPRMFVHVRIGSCWLPDANLILDSPVTAYWICLDCLLEASCIELIVRCVVFRGRWVRLREPVSHLHPHLKTGAPAIRERLATIDAGRRRKVRKDIIALYQSERKICTHIARTELAYTAISDNVRDRCQFTRTADEGGAHL